MAVQRRFQFISDPELVDIARMGSLEACDELVSRFRGAVLLVAEQMLRSREAAQDVAQEAFLLAFRALHQLQDSAKFAGWLCAITRHRARRVAARESRSEAAESSELERLATGQNESHEPGPLEQALREEKRAAVRAVLADLPEEIQSVLFLFYYEQWPALRIAEFLSLPLSTIKWRLRAGRQQLRRRLDTLLEEKPDVRQQSESRNTPNAYSAAQDRGDGRTRRTDGQLRRRRAQLCETLQYDCGTP